MSLSYRTVRYARITQLLGGPAHGTAIPDVRLELPVIQLPVPLDLREGPGTSSYRIASYPLKRLPMRGVDGSVTVLCCHVDVDMDEEGVRVAALIHLLEGADAIYREYREPVYA